MAFDGITIAAMVKELHLKLEILKVIIILMLCIVFNW